MTKVWRLLSILIIPLMCLGLLLVPAAIAPKVASAATLNCGIEVQPDITKVGFIQNFSVNVTITNPTSEALDFVMCHIDFSKALIEVVSIDAGSAVGSSFDTKYAKTFDNTAGTLDVDYSTPSGENTTAANPIVCTINMRSKSASGTATLDFIAVDEFGDPATAVIGAVADHLNWDMVVNGTVKVGPPTLTVNVSPNGTGVVKINGTIPSGYPNTTTRSWNESVTLEAVNSVPNWTFTEWSGDLTGSDNTTNITMDWDKNVTAHFVPAGTTATLEGHVDLTGLPATNVTVRFFAPNTTTEYVAMKTHTITDSNGNFTIPGIDPGTYDVGVKGSTSLSNLESGVNLTGGGTTYRDFGVLLEGDASGDDYVDGSDFGPLSDAWLSYPGCPKGNWDATVDFSRDNYIDGSDFGPLSDDWLKWGDCFGWSGNWT